MHCSLAHLSLSDKVSFCDQILSVVSVFVYTSPRTGIYWLNINWVLAIYSFNAKKKVPNKFEALVGYLGVLLGKLTL